MPTTDFKFDVFLSHSSKDNEIVRDVAERLRADGLRVWPCPPKPQGEGGFDEWEITAGDNIPAKIEDGLEHSRILVLCMSANAFGSEWTHLESGTFRFRDPLNKARRLIPLRLDDAPIKGSLAQFSYINWRRKGRKQAYAKLLEACRPPADLSDVALAKSEAQAPGKQVAEEALQLDTKTLIWGYAFSPDGKHALTAAHDNTVRLWDVAMGRCLRVLEGHATSVRTVA